MMLSYLVGRLLHALAVVAAACALSFALLHFAPGDALAADTTHAGRSAEARAALRKRLGLDLPVGVQLVRYAGQTLRGDLGRSLVDDRPVAVALGAALKNSLLLTAAALVVAVTIGLLVGGAQGWRPNWRLGRVLGATLTAFYSIPEFVLAIGMIGVLSYWMAWFPIGGISDTLITITGTASAQLRDRLWHLTVPALTLALGWGAAIARQQRVALLETVGSDHVRTARAKGLAERQVLLRHAVRPSFPAVAVMIGLMLPVLVSGAVVVEIVFAWPGMGSLMLRAVGQRDVPMVSGGIVLVAAVVSASSLVVDGVVRWIDPRQR